MAKIDTIRIIIGKKPKVRIPTAPPGGPMKAKKGKHVKYSRKKKHLKGDVDDHS
jgi:hypothetical protein